MMVGIHLHGFVWLYEKNRGGIAIALAVILMAASVCWFAFLASIMVFDPVSFLTFFFGFDLFGLRGVSAERKERIEYRGLALH